MNGPGYPPLALYDRFDTNDETGCVVRSLPDRHGMFTATDPDGWEVSYHVRMVTRVHPATDTQKDTP